MRSLIVLAVLFVAICGEANAAAPTLQSVGHQDRHPTGVFSAPGAESVTVYISTSPDRATDGKFLSENLKDIDFLTAEERASGTWLDSDQLDPGVYYVMVDADDYDFECGADCMDGFSAVMTLTIPKPAQRYRGKFKHGILASLILTVTPLDGVVPYKVCWTGAKGRKRCLRSSVTGYDWNDAASDTEYLTREDAKIGKRQKRMTFVWYVKGKRVASKTIRVR